MKMVKFREELMSGYYTDYGYMGYVGGEWMLFATEDEYYEYLKEDAA